MNQDKSDKQTHFLQFTGFLILHFLGQKRIFILQIRPLVQMSNFLCAELNADTCRQKPLCQLIYPEFGT